MSSTRRLRSSRHTNRLKPGPASPIQHPPRPLPEPLPRLLPGLARQRLGRLAAEVAIALRTAACSQRSREADPSVEIVWTGPRSENVSFRHTEQAILQVLNSAQSRILLVSYAVYSIPNIQDAVVRAARRGVQITVVVETPDKLDVQNEYSTLKALGDDVAKCSTVYYWPKENRKADASGKLGILHVKCVVGDGRWLFLSSANLTKYAFSLNMEMGLLLTGGEHPAQVERHFARLIADKEILCLKP